MDLSLQHKQDSSLETSQKDDLRSSLSHCLNWQHQLCKVKKQDPKIKSLYHDHSCQESDVPMVSPPEGQFKMLPRNVAVVLNQGSPVTSMDFHPSLPTILLVGTKVGEVSVWDVSTQKRFKLRKFKVWNRELSLLFQSALAQDNTVSVNRVIWSSDGSQLGVAFSKHLVHLYKYISFNTLIPFLEINAHVGGVNDICFSQQKCAVVTCGDDKKIKVWDCVKGVLQYTLEGHETSVYSICLYSKGYLIFSSSLDGHIKGWMYSNQGPLVEFKAPGHGCTSTTIAYSTDEKRRFSCGTSKDGDSYFVEWTQSPASILQEYTGLEKISAETVQFDTTGNRFLAAGNNHIIKFWDMDNPDLLTTTDAEGGLPASPRIRFNMAGALLAVSTTDNCIKVLANDDWFQYFQYLHNQKNSAPKSLSEQAITKGT